MSERQDVSVDGRHQSITQNLVTQHITATLQPCQRFHSIIRETAKPKRERKEIMYIDNETR